jgi:hypothetical protein
MVVLLLAATAATAQGDNESSRETLRGLKEVEVLIESLTPEAEANGLDKSAIQTDVELTLRQAGIKVLTGAKALAAPGAPALYVRVSTFRRKTEPGFYSFSMEVRLEQSVRLERDPRMRALLAATWSSSGYIGTVGSANLKELRNSLKDEMNQFINAWLSVNPK